MPCSPPTAPCSPAPGFPSVLLTPPTDPFHGVDFSGGASTKNIVPIVTLWGAALRQWKAHPSPSSTVSPQHAPATEADVPAKRGSGTPKYLPQREGTVTHQ